MLLKVRIFHRIILHRMRAEQMKELRRSQLNRTMSSRWKDSWTIIWMTLMKIFSRTMLDTFEVFIWHYHNTDLVNRESFPKLFDVATPM